jgi:hypothetical protein
MGEWRKLHSGELHNLYSTPHIIRQIKSRRIWFVGMWHKTVQDLVGKPEGKRPLEKRSHKWEDGIRMDLREISWEGGRVDSPGSG